MLTGRGDRDVLTGAVAAWLGGFTDLGPGLRVPGEGVYAEDVSIRVPLRTVEGRTALEAYFTGLSRTMRNGGFDDHEVVYGGEGVWVHGTMHVTLRLGPVGRVEVEGASRLRVSGGRIAEQLDVYDAGRAVYEQVPLLGMAVRLAKRAMQVAAGRFVTLRDG